MPKSILYPLMRSKRVVHTEVPAALTFCVALTKEDLEGAFRILHDSYVESGFMQPVESGMRINKYFALPSTTTLVAKWQGKVVGTVSIVRKTGLGLPMEKNFDS